MSKTKILVVDDEISICEILKDYLDNYGYETTITQDTVTALKLLGEITYDVAILDKNMPDSNSEGFEGGFEILKYIKRYRPGIQTILITGNASLDSAIRALKLGAFDYITKPFKMEELNNIIQRIKEYKKFINPDSVLDVYHDIYNKIMEIIDSKEVGHTHLSELERTLDLVFKYQKEREDILIEQREALSNILTYSNELLEFNSISEDCKKVLDKIIIEAEKKL